jgi:glutamate dehydrogenase/leucine dehydrogenase
VTPDAEKALHARGIMVNPDVLDNSGGVATSYFEWQQNREGMYQPESVILERLEWQMHAAYRDVDAFAKERKCTMRAAAFAIAIRRIGAALEARGWR